MDEAEKADDCAGAPLIAIGLAGDADDARSGSASCRSGRSGDAGFPVGRSGASEMTVSIGEWLMCGPDR